MFYIIINDSTIAYKLATSKGLLNLSILRTKCKFEKRVREFFPCLC